MFSNFESLQQFLHRFVQPLPVTLVIWQFASPKRRRPTWKAVMAMPQPIWPQINRVVNDDEECSRPVEFQYSQNRLFS